MLQLLPFFGVENVAGRTPGLRTSIWVNFGRRGRVEPGNHWNAHWIKCVVHDSLRRCFLRPCFFLKPEKMGDVYFVI